MRSEVESEKQNFDVLKCEMKISMTIEQWAIFRNFLLDRTFEHENNPAYLIEGKITQMLFAAHLQFGIEV